MPTPSFPPEEKLTANFLIHPISGPHEWNGLLGVDVMTPFPCQMRAIVVS